MTDAYRRQYLYRRIVKAKLYIDEHFADCIDLSGIADEACFSKFHFIRLFKEIYGKPPHQYLTHVRVEKAKQYLAKSETVAKVCFTVGFDSISSFTGLFKRRVGLTPAAFQVKMQKLQSEMSTKPITFVPNCFAEKKGWKKIAIFEK